MSPHLVPAVVHHGADTLKVSQIGFDFNRTRVSSEERNTVAAHYFSIGYNIELLTKTDISLNIPLTITVCLSVLDLYVPVLCCGLINRKFICLLVWSLLDELLDG